MVSSLFVFSFSILQQLRSGICYSKGLVSSKNSNVKANQLNVTSPMKSSPQSNRVYTFSSTELKGVKKIYKKNDFHRRKGNKTEQIGYRQQVLHSHSIFPHEHLDTYSHRQSHPPSRIPIPTLQRSVNLPINNASRLQLGGPGWDPLTNLLIPLSSPLRCSHNLFPSLPL